MLCVSSFSCRDSETIHCMGRGVCVRVCVYPAGVVASCWMQWTTFKLLRPCCSRKKKDTSVTLFTCSVPGHFFFFFDAEKLLNSQPPMQNFLVLVSLTRDPVHSFATGTIYIWIFHSLMKNKRTCVPPSICFSCFTWRQTSARHRNARPIYIVAILICNCRLLVV